MARYRAVKHSRERRRWTGGPEASAGERGKEIKVQVTGVGLDEERERSSSCLSICMPTGTEDREGKQHMNETSKTKTVVLGTTVRGHDERSPQG